MTVRAFTVVEIGGRRHVATPIPVPHGLQAAWVTVIARADGTEPVVVFGWPNGGVACTCPQGQRDELCDHVVALQTVGLVNRPEPVRPSQIGFWEKVMYGVNGKAGHESLSNQGQSQLPYRR